MTNRNKAQDERIRKLQELLSGQGTTQSTVKTRRCELGLSQRGLARRSGVSQPTISRIESGEELLTTYASQKLSIALKMDRQELGLAENLSLMRRLATEGQLKPEAAVRVALQLLETQPASEAGRRMSDAALAALTDIAEAAAKAPGGGSVALKTHDKRGRRIDDSLPVKKRNGSANVTPGRDHHGRRIKKPNQPMKGKADFGAGGAE